MAITITLPHLAVSQAVGGASVAFGNMDTTGPIGKACYRFISTTACFIDQGIAPVATAASMAVAAGETIMLDGAAGGAKVAVLQQAAGGTATLTPVMHL